MYDPINKVFYPLIILGLVIFLSLSFKRNIKVRNSLTLSAFLRVLFIVYSSIPTILGPAINYFKGENLEDRAVADFGNFLKALEDLDNEAPILPILSNNYMDNAIRYRLNRPITYSWKDNNFFAYVGSDDLSHWGELTEYMTIIKSSKGKDASSAVVSMAQILMHG